VDICITLPLYSRLFVVCGSYLEKKLDHWSRKVNNMVLETIDYFCLFMLNHTRMGRVVQVNVPMKMVLGSVFVDDVAKDFKSTMDTRVKITEPGGRRMGDEDIELPLIPPECGLHL
jgi:hypothetical protein